MNNEQRITGDEQWLMQNNQLSLRSLRLCGSQPDAFIRTMKNPESRMRDADATQCYNQQRHDDVIYSQGGSRGIERTDKNFTKPLFSSATSLCKNNEQRTTTRRHDDVIYSQAVKCSVDIPVCNDAASILSMNAHGQNAHATQCYNEQRTTTRRHDDVIYSQGGRRGKGRTDKNFTKLLFASATSLCKNDEYLLFIERQRRAAFTLIEILVVLSIIVLLIAILVPAAIIAERYAYSSATEGDLAAIGQALSVYHSDFNMYPDSDLCGQGSSAPALYATLPAGGPAPVSISQGFADEYLAECLLGYLPGEEDGYPPNVPVNNPPYLGTGTGSEFPNTAGFTMQPYKKVYGPYMPVNAQNIIPAGNGNYYFAGDFPPNAGTPLPILYFSATTSPSTSQIFGAKPGVGIFCSGDDPGAIPDVLTPLQTPATAANQFFQLIGDKTGTNNAAGGNIMGRNSYLLVAPGPSQASYGGDSLVYGGQ